MGELCLAFVLQRSDLKLMYLKSFLTGIVLVLVLNPFLLPKQTEASNWQKNDKSSGLRLWLCHFKISSDTPAFNVWMHNQRAITLYWLLPLQSKDMLHSEGISPSFSDINITIFWVGNASITYIVQCYCPHILPPIRLSICTWFWNL